MRTRMGFVIISCAVLSLALAAVLLKNVSSKEPGDGDAWEYLVVAGGSVNLESMNNSEFAGMRKQPDGSFREATVLEHNLDKLGAKGWQLVSVYGSPNNPIYYFKRPKEKK
ncbi:MAG: hypothetical protein J2P31_00260 [Blastocatellia bacterium]|nr:hypothetical protein [Blastocatellia bacterium]